MIEFIAFLKAFPALVSAIKELSEDIKNLRQQSIDKELDSIKSDVDNKIKILIMAVNDEQRKKALLDLSRAIGR